MSRLNRYIKITVDDSGTISATEVTSWVNNHTKGATRMKTSAKKRKRPTAKDCAKCEYNNRIKCGVDFCVLLGCVKVKEGGNNDFEIR